MADDFQYDVFLSHSSKDKPIVRALAERLRADKIRVWFDDWELRPGDSIPARIEEGLEHSRVLVLCMSAHAFGSDWSQLESGTFRFRDPLNRQRRLIPIRLDETKPKGSLAQFLHIDWLPGERERSYAKLLEACRPPSKPPTAEAQAAREQLEVRAVQLDIKGSAILSYEFSGDGKRVLTGSHDATLCLWDAQTGHSLRVFKGHTGDVRRVAWSKDGLRALSGSDDCTVRLWDVASGRCLRVFKGHRQMVLAVAWSPDERRALSGSQDKTLRLWDVETGRHLHTLGGPMAIGLTLSLWDVLRGRQLRVLRGHTGKVMCVAWSSDGRRALSGSGSDDKTVRLWDVETGHCLRVFNGHTASVWAVTWSADERRALTGSQDKTLRLWDVETGRCLRVLEGHTDIVRSVAWSADGRLALSISDDKTVRLWDVETGRCLCVLEGHTSRGKALAWSADQRHAFSGDYKGGVRVWDLSKYVGEARAT